MNKTLSQSLDLLPPVVNVHVEPTNICTLKCPGCARTQFIDRWPQHWHNHSVDPDQLFRFVDIDIDSILFCGNEGDPIYHKEFHRIVEHFKKRNIAISVMTNGSHKDQHWWDTLVGLLDQRDTVIFSIDGLPESSPQYRINSDWTSIKVGIESAAKSLCKTHWKFIPFSFNQDQIEQARQLSKDLGMDKFEVNASDRFDQHTEHLKPTIDFVDSRHHAKQQWRQGNVSTVQPRCKSGIQHYISAYGAYSPCCYVADYRFYHKTMWGKNKNDYSISNTTLSEILARPTVVEFYQTLENQKACQYNCPKK